MATNTADLLAGLKALTAAPARQIVLAPGQYGPLVLSGLKYDVPVEVVCDPANPAVFTSLQLSDLKGIIFRGLKLDARAGRFKATGCEDVHFDGLKVLGDPAVGPDKWAGSFAINSSKRVSIRGSELAWLKNGLDIGGNYDVTVEGNHFHDIRVDGVDSTGASKVTINANYFHDFRHLAGDHSDAVQFFTKNRNASVADLVVTNNLMDQGLGAVMQGVFMSDEMGTLPYQRVKIAGNIILGGNWNGVFNNNGQDVEISDNWLYAYAGSPSTPRIVWNDKVAGKVVNNGAPSYSKGKVAVTANNVTTAALARPKAAGDGLKALAAVNPALVARIDPQVRRWL